jgi:hypothetical protein
MHKRSGAAKGRQPLFFFASAGKEGIKKIFRPKKGFLGREIPVGSVALPRKADSSLKKCTKNEGGLLTSLFNKYSFLR